MTNPVVIEVPQAPARYSYAGDIEPASEGANPPAIKGTWYNPQGVLPGGNVTLAAGSRDLYITEAESAIFAELQSLAAGTTFDFWNDPREDIYEDLPKA
ncbi:MAG: hypothetical protein WBD05_09830 [Phycisphaerae bacterium]